LSVGDSKLDVRVLETDRLRGGEEGDYGRGGFREQPVEQTNNFYTKPALQSPIQNPKLK
jgi:hypothetical protein